MTSKTKLSEITVVNDKIFKQVAKINKMKEADVEEIFTFVAKFIGKTIEEGSMQAVMIPYFGKFKPKEKHIRAIKETEAARENGTLELHRIMKYIKHKIK